MQSIEIIEQDEDHLVLSSDEPCRFEVTMLPLSGRMLVYGYSGATTDPEQDPTVVYDGSVTTQLTT